MNLRDLSIEHLGQVGLLAQRRRGNHIDGREAPPPAAATCRWSTPPPR